MEEAIRACLGSSGQQAEKSLAMLKLGKDGENWSGFAQGGEEGGESHWHVRA